MVVMHKNQDFMLQWHYFSTSLIHQQGGQFFTATQHHISEDCKTGNPCVMPQCFNFPCQYTLLLTLCPLIFILTPSVDCILGCCRECMKITVQNKAGRQYTHCKLISHCALTTYITVMFCSVFICLYLSIFLLHESET